MDVQGLTGPIMGKDFTHLSDIINKHMWWRLHPGSTFHVTGLLLIVCVISIQNIINENKKLHFM